MGSRRFLCLAGVAWILAFAGELIEFWVLNSSHRVDDLSPRTFHYFWALAAIAGCSWGLGRLLSAATGHKRGPAWQSVFITVWIAGVAACIGAAVDLLVPVDWRLPRPVYGGLEVRLSDDTEIAPQGDGSERAAYAYPAFAGFLYRYDDPELSAAVAEAKMSGNHPRVRQFFFWRTGVAAGFQPYGFETGVETLGPLLKPADRMALLMTVGPTVLLECLLRSALFGAPFLLVIGASWHLVRVRRRT